jgi:hypothetical protein
MQNMTNADRKRHQEKVKGQALFLGAAETIKPLLDLVEESIESARNREIATAELAPIKAKSAREERGYLLTLRDKLKAAMQAARDVDVFWSI